MTSVKLLVAGSNLADVADGGVAKDNLGVQRDVSANVVRAMRGLRSALPSQPAAQSVSPVITLTSAVDAATPLVQNAYLREAGKLNPVFLFSGWPTRQGGTVSPTYNGVRSEGFPSNPSGFGYSISDFLSDAAAISIPQIRAQAGSLRIIVDDVEVLRCGTAIRAGTAQAGAASTVTLDAGASATNGQYFNNWVHITGGTGVGQYAQITGYVGATKVATVAPAWTTVPDATSTFEMTQVPMAFTTSTQAGFGTYYFKLDWKGERRMRHYRIECDATTFLGCYVPSVLDSVIPHAPPTGPPAYWCGDSYSGGTGADCRSSSLARVCCDRLGWSLHNLSIGGTGYLNPGVNSLPAETRMIPPANAWFVFTQSATAGSFTLTQGGITTEAVNFNDAIATIQTKINTAFGAGKFLAAGDVANLVLIGLGENAGSAAAMTANFAGLTATYPVIKRWLGDLAPQLAKDGNGNVLPFNIVLCNGLNDTTEKNAEYTKTLLRETVEKLITNLYGLYPMATIYVMGTQRLPGGGAIPAGVTASNEAIQEATTAKLKKINGKVPFIETLAAGIFTGTGHVGLLTGDGTGDVDTYTDGVHPTNPGHMKYGSYYAVQILGLYGAS